MKHSDFIIGGAFTTGHGLWRCTDIGTRTVVAIRLDHAEIVTLREGREEQRTIDPRQEPGWLSGPPYAVAETVFDEYDLPVCQPIAEEDVMGWMPKGRCR